MARPEGTVVLVGMPALDATFTLPALAAVFSGKRLMGSVVGGSQILRDFPRFIQLAESGRLDLGSLVSKRIGLDEINDGLDTLTRAGGRPHGGRVGPDPSSTRGKGFRDGRADAAPARAGAHLLR